MNTNDLRRRLSHRPSTAPVDAAPASKATAPEAHPFARWGARLLPADVRSVVASTAAPTAAFAIVQTVLAGINLGLTAVPMMFDVTTTYKGWADQWFQHSVLVGVDTPWVYPILALLPMLAAGAFGASGYGSAWLAIVALLNLGAVTALAVRSRGAAWWWVAFTACLGPIALGRIDAVALPLAIIGVLLLARRPAAASVVLTIATWVKIWPAAILLAVVVVLRSRRGVIRGAMITTGVIVATVLLLGGGAYLLSAGSMQATRGVQVESPIALPWLWLAHFRPDLAHTYFDVGIITYQIAGPGVQLAASLMTPVLPLGVAVILVLAWRCRTGRGRTFSGDVPGDGEVLALAALGMVASLVALNKVGSPQYMTWLAAPVVLGLITDARRFRTPALMTAAAALLTQIIYPWRYDDVLGTTTPMLIVLTLRDLLELGLLLWPTTQLLSAGRRVAAGGVGTARPSAIPA